ncbi:fasciclin domain-containing protein [Crocosphaera sp.]|uniref:fasciclin domain-containing protein n=1 Tax=Crocosphaera sp. TaxID=2729996 RepID=UPI00260C5702|nr:fasciclin domain-containing protein [Crocosphaera sp.]MDJ0581450.1 fasciclin domain-containing protein [Crocosphaera sp.]
MTGLKSFSALVGGLLALGFSVAPAVADKIEQKASQPETQIVAGHHETKTKNIVETAVAADDFESLVAAVEAAGLVDVLSSGEKKYTVFAPTDEAFAALGEENVKELLKPENKEKLAAILKYHVVPGVVKSTDLQEGKVKVETVEGSKVKIKLDGSEVTVNDANVVQADIMTSNGVIHVIDKVILPSDK